VRARALAKLAFRREDQTILAVGQRAATQLKPRGQEVEETLEVPGSTAGITSTVHDVLPCIEDWHSRRGIAMVGLFYCRPHSGASYRPRGIRVLPVDLEWIHSLKARPWTTRMVPMYTMDTGQLFHSLIREYLFVSLFRAFAESLASENASRLASMQLAARNIEERLKSLAGEFRQSRQNAISSELLDIVSAFEALKGKERY
jgi:F-type H+-transporting ATPase subunit gamma